MLKKRNPITRRHALGAMAGASGAVLALGSHAAAADEAPLKGRLKQSVSAWCYKIPLEELAKEAARIGLKSVELLDEKQWSVVQDQGLTCAMPNGPGGIAKGWNDPRNHDELVAKSEDLLPKIKTAGLDKMIVFSGNRRPRLDESEGLRNCVRGLKRIVPLAEELGITLTMELLNSKRDHNHYMCDHTAWGVALAKDLGTKNFGLLYDIYHMQIMEGDIITTIQENIDYIVHFHTGGVPGRNEIDDSQELNYRRIAQAIVDTGYDGYFGHEFVPAGPDPIASLTEAARICDV
ncbi:MAG: hydroxypyruvate isomerase family protein [Candidatus Hydrogenedentota bacterium]